jgi:hypothetical protein
MPNREVLAAAPRIIPARAVALKKLRVDLAARALILRAVGYGQLNCGKQRLFCSQLVSDGFLSETD